MEAYQAWLGGEAWQLNSDDIKLLNENTNEFEEPSAESELLMRYFRKPSNGELGTKLTNSEIKSHIETRTHQRLSVRKLVMELKSMGYEQEINIYDGRVKRVTGMVEL